MADLDDENKRRFGVGTLPLPDGTIDAGDRGHIVGVYPGITIDAPAVPEVESPRVWRAQSYDRSTSVYRAQSYDRSSSTGRPKPRY